MQRRRGRYMLVVGGSVLLLATLVIPLLARATDQVGGSFWRVLTYVVLALGFGLVIGFPWVDSAWARKFIRRETRADPALVASMVVVAHTGSTGSTGSTGDTGGAAREDAVLVGGASGVTFTTRGGATGEVPWSAVSRIVSGPAGYDDPNTLAASPREHIVTLLGAPGTAVASAIPMHSGGNGPLREWQVDELCRDLETLRQQWAKAENGRL